MNSFKIALVSLGCSKNLVDSEMILGILARRGYSIVVDETEADLIIVNTCAFINDAKEESINTIINLAELKEDSCKALVVTGCLANRYEKEIKAELPEVDAVISINDYDSLVDFIDDVSSQSGFKPISDCRNILAGDRLRSTAPHTAYVKISEGCNNRCTYCVIPYIRGNYVSRPIEEIEEEVKALADSGVKEIIVIAQDTTYYGRDIYGKPSLEVLLKKLSDIEGIEWIRCLYMYPEEMTEELVDFIANNDKICKYLDIPIQHISDSVLKAMARRGNKKDIYDLISKIREKVKGVTLRTTLIVGFPGETDEDFEELKEFIKFAKFDKLGVFTYSKEEGTKAAEMKNQIPEKIKKQRYKDIMELQQQVSLDNNQTLVGENVKVLVEGIMPDGMYFGRTYKDAPDVDGYAFVESDENLPLGDFVEATVVKAVEYDLYCQYTKGEKINELT